VAPKQHIARKLMIGGSMNKDNMLINMNCIYELEEKDYLKFLHGIVERNSQEYFSNIPLEWENSKRLPKEREEVGNRIYLSLLTCCLTALKFLQDNSVKYFELDKVGAILKNKNKLTRFIDVLEEYIFIDHVTGLHNERWFNKIIYNEMEMVVKTNKSISLISLQLDDTTTPTLHSEREKEFQLDKTKTFVAIVKKILKDDRDELFHMNTNEFLIVSKEQETGHINTRIESIMQEVIESIKNAYLYFGVTRITRGQLEEDFNIITYLKNVDEEVYQDRHNHQQKQNNR
jgi:GGDEF domain-containing protein